MKGDEGLTIVETLVALAIVSMAIFAVSGMLQGPRRAVAFGDAKRFVIRAQFDAITSGDAVTLIVRQNSIERQLAGSTFATEGLHFETTRPLGEAQGVVAFPDGAFSAGIIARDGLGRSLNLTPITVLDPQLEQRQ